MKPVLQHPALDRLIIPFNRVGVSPQVAIFIPCYRYDIESEDRDATLYFQYQGERFSLPVRVLFTLPIEMRECLDMAKFRTLASSKIQARFNALKLDIIDVNVDNFKNFPKN
jgi:hypothetical protein